MKHILLLRHAKSSHEDASLKDFDRPLAPRGERDAIRMGKFLKNIDSLPGLVVSSTAKRAEQTTRLFIEGAELSESIVQWNEDFYYGSSQDYLESIQVNNSNTDCIMLIGHNPKIEDIGRRLCGNGSIRMPTTGLACFEQPANTWEQIREGLASIKWMMTPKMLAKMDG